MPIKLDSALLAELGLAELQPETKRALLQFIYDKLELNVGTTLANMMTNEQLDEFEQFIDNEGGNAEQPEALAWLEKNLPFYKVVVQETFEALKDEVRQNASGILAADRVPMGGAA